MKQKLVSLFGIIGCALGLFTAGSLGGFLGYVLCLLGGFSFVVGVMFFTSVYGGKVWGINIPMSPVGKKKYMLSIPALIVGGYGIGCVIRCLLTFRISAIIGLALFVIGILVAVSFLKKFTEKSIAKGDNALCLGEIELFKQIDNEIKTASHFVVGFEGVALFSSANYCYAVYRYEDYQLGELSTVEEVALVGTYFVQKYHEEFTFKVDEEVIPGEPGQTVVAVGMGGISVARVKGTRDQRLFRSYIFTKH